MALNPSSSAMRAAARQAEPLDINAPRCRCLVRLLCSPGSDSLEYTHQFLTSYLDGRLRPQVAQRLGVAGYELMSNALNYSSMAEDIALEIFDLPESAAIRVANETIAPRISMLNEHMQKIRNNAEAALVGEMRRSVTGGPVRPMLGLARIVHEVSLQLDVSIRERRVTMTASCLK
ncbi:MAG TPA: hypothetical protein VGM29_15510 [Polyangiaceae bacterium]